MLTQWSHLKLFIREPLQFIHKEQTDSSLRPWLVFCWPEYVLLLISTAVHLASVLLWCSPQHTQQTCPYAPTMDSCGWTAGLCRQCKPTLIPRLGVHAGLTTVAKNGLNLLWGNCCICAKAVVLCLCVHYSFLYCPYECWLLSLSRMTDYERPCWSWSWRCAVWCQSRSLDTTWTASPKLQSKDSLWALTLSSHTFFPWSEMFVSLLAGSSLRRERKMARRMTMRRSRGRGW